MTRQKFSPLLVLSLLVAATWFFAALLWSAPEPNDKQTLDQEEAVEPVKATELEAAQNLKKSQKNLRTIALAFDNCGATVGHTPSNWGVTKDGKTSKPHLSWRVAILPYLEEDKLYREFKFDEPWDSEHNKKLIEKMPEVYSSPRVVVKKKGFTVYQGFAGEGALFETAKELKWPSSIKDDKSKQL